MVQGLGFRAQGAGVIQDIGCIDCVVGPRSGGSRAWVSGRGCWIPQPTTFPWLSRTNAKFKELQLDSNDTTMYTKIFIMGIKAPVFVQ